MSDVSNNLPVNPLENFTEEPVDNFYQNPIIGGTPHAFINYIDPLPFKPIIWHHWGFFEEEFVERGSNQPLAYVDIVFNRQIYLTGQGQWPANYFDRPYFATFEGPQFDEIKEAIAKVAHRLGIVPTTVKNAFAHQVLPNLVHVISPELPDPAGRNVPERGGRFSNI